MRVNYKKCVSRYEHFCPCKKGDLDVTYHERPSLVTTFLMWEKRVCLRDMGVLNTSGVFGKLKFVLRKYKELVAMHFLRYACKNLAVKLC